MKLEELRSAYEAAHKVGQEILDKVDAEKREMTDEERSSVQSAIAQKEKLKADIDLRSRHDADARGLNEGTTQPIKMPLGEGEVRSRITIPATARRSVKNFRGENAVEDAYKSGMFLRASIGGDYRAAEWCRDHGVVSVDQYRAMAGNSNPAGGYLVPVEFSNAIIDLRDSYGVARQNAHNEPMASDVKVISKVLSGVTAYWLTDNDEITASDPAFGQVELVARKLAALTKFSSELDEDSTISIAEQLSKEFAKALARSEDDAFFNGDGTSTYGSVTGLATKLAAATASIYTCASTHTAFSTMTLADFNGVVGLLPEYAEKIGSPKWYFSKPGYSASAQRLQDAAGGNTGLDLATGKPTREFMGYPVVTSPLLNSTLTTQASAIVGFFGCLELAATIGERRGLTIARSEHRYFETDSIGLRATERVAINVHSVGTTSVVGPVIAIKLAGS